MPTPGPGPGTKPPIQKPEKLGTQFGKSQASERNRHWERDSAHHSGPPVSISERQTMAKPGPFGRSNAWRRVVRWSAIGAGEGIRTFDPNLGKF